MTPQSSKPNIQNPKTILLGTTFSHTHAKSLGLNVTKTFEDLLGWKFDLVRLCTYWNSIQSMPSTFNLSSIIPLLDACESTGQKVILSVGLKAPRWPEFYQPSWLVSTKEEDLVPWLFSYLERLVNELKHYQCIAYWQVENEPLDPVIPSFRHLSYSLLEQEITLVRQLDSRPIHLNTYAVLLPWRQTHRKLAALADTVGIDLYFRVPPPTPWPAYIRWKDSNSSLCRSLKQINQPLWITELQSEPWEKKKVDPKIDPPSMNAGQLQHNFDQAISLDPAAILFWGYEYWSWKRQHGDSSLWDKAKQIQAALRRR